MIRSLLLACAVGATLSIPAAAQTSAGVGDKPVFSFRDPLFNGQGVTSLEDLRGKPVLVDFWGTKCGPCVGFAVPSAMKLAEEYGDDLVVLLVECQGTPREAVASFALGKKWLGNGAMWTTERVFDLGLRGIPQSALLSPEGEIVLAGYTTEIHGQLEDKVAELVAASKAAPEGTPKSLHKAWKDFGKGEFAKALAAARKIAADADDLDAAAARETVAEFERRLAAKVQRAAWQVENGFALRGLERLEALGKNLGKEGELATRVAALIESTQANGAELDAAKALDRVESKLYADGPDEKWAKKLREVATKHAGTKAAARAEQLARMVEAA